MADRSDTIGLIRRLASRLPSSPGALSGAKWVYCACQLGAVRFGTLVAEVLPPDFCCYLGLSDGVRRLMIEDIDMMSLSIQLMFVRCVSMQGEREA